MFSSDFQPSGIIFHPPTLSQPLPRHFLPSLQDSSRSDNSNISHAPPTCIDSWTFDGDGNAKWHKFKLGNLKKNQPSFNLLLVTT